MKILELFFIIAILIACMFGLLFAMSTTNNPASAIDSYGNTASTNTNMSAQLVQSISGGVVNTTVNGTTTTNQIASTGITGMMGWFIVLIATFVIIVVSLFIISSFKKMPRGGYRRG